MPDKRKNIKRSNILQLTLGIIILILINIISSFIFTRFDLTAEKRYSLSPATKKLVENLKDEVFFKVYLEGEDLPPAFTRLANETREMLDEFRAYNEKIQYEFVNPSENVNAKERNDAYKLLIERGLQPTDLRVNKKGQSSQLIIFPGAMVSYRGKEAPVQLLMTQLGEDPDKVLNTSIQALEYNLASTIQKLNTSTKPRIAFIDGQGELSRIETIDFEEALAEFYTVERVTIDNKINSLAIRLKGTGGAEKIVNQYKAIIIAKPVKPFNEKDKFLIDQFIMRGGKVLWLLDPVFASMDSLQGLNATMGILNNTNLDDILFNYGVRLNANLIMDLKSMMIPLRTGQVGNQPQIEFFPWYYFPVITPSNNHPIVNGLNAIRTEFISSLDTAEVTGVKKTILLTTSPYSRTVNAPCYIDLDILKKEPDQRLYNKGPQNVAVLLEGNFVSAYQFRLPPEIADNKEIEFQRKSAKPGKMIVISDGDVIKNQFRVKDGQVLPLGYDQWTRQTFGNKDFLLNAMNYLCDESGLIMVRSRELKLRQLDPMKINNQRVIWQVVNLIVPLLLILIFGLVKYQMRKRKFSTTTAKPRIQPKNL